MNPIEEKSIRIGSQEFSIYEWKEVLKIAKPKKGFHAQLTPQNIIRLALGLPLRQRGGARPNTGNRKPPLGTPSGVAKTGRRAGSKQKKP